jgi:hypothetical protein
MGKTGFPISLELCSPRELTKLGNRPESIVLDGSGLRRRCSTV